MLIPERNLALNNNAASSKTNKPYEGQVYFKKVGLKIEIKEFKIVNRMIAVSAAENSCALPTKRKWNKTIVTNPKLRQKRDCLRGENLDAKKAGDIKSNLDLKLQHSILQKVLILME